MRYFQIYPKFRFSSVLLSLLALISSTVNAAQKLQTFTIGVVPQHDVRHLIDIWMPVIDYLNKKSTKNFVLITSPDIPAFEKQLEDGIFDFAYVNPFQYLRASKKKAYQAILRDDSKRLEGIVVVNRNSHIKKIAQLEGKKIAFPAPNALGATLMVRYEFDKLHGINIIPRYVKTHKSVYLQVATGRYLAGGGVTRTLDSQDINLRNKLQVLYKTGSLYPHPVAVHPRVNASDTKNFITDMLALSETEKGKKILKRINMKKLTRAQHKDYIELDSINLNPYAH